MYVVVFLIVLLDLWFRFVVFKNASREAKSEKCENGIYLVFAILLAMLSLVSIIFNLKEVIEGTFKFETFASILLEITFLVTMLEMFAAAVRIRRHKKSAFVGEDN